MSGNKLKDVGVSDKNPRGNWALAELTCGLGN